MRLHQPKGIQKIPLRIESENSTYEIYHLVLALTDKVLIDFDECRQVAVVGDGRHTGTETNTATAAVKLWDKVCSGVEGYGDSDEDLPEDWRELVPIEDKMAVIDHILTCVVVEPEDADETQKGRVPWGTNRTKTINTESYFNNEIIQTSHTLRAKTAQDYAEYERINRLMFENQRSGLRRKSERLAVFPATMRGKGALYDKVVVSNTGYEGGVPLHHKAVVIDAYFTPKVDTEKK